MLDEAGLMRDETDFRHRTKLNLERVPSQERYFTREKFDLILSRLETTVVFGSTVDRA